MVTPGDTIKHIISTFISPVPSWQAFGQCQSAFPLGIGMLAPLRRLMSASAMWFARIPGSSSLFSISKDPHWLCVDASERAFVSSSLEFAACATPSPLPLRDNSWKGEVSVVSLRNTNAYLCPGLLESLAKSLSVIYSAGALDLSSNRMHPAERNCIDLWLQLSDGKDSPRWRYSSTVPAFGKLVLNPATEYRTEWVLWPAREVQSSELCWLWLEFGHW